MLWSASIISHSFCFLCLCAVHRQLSKAEFTVFLQRYCLLSDTKLSDIADDMIKRLSLPDKEDAPSEDAMQEQLHAVSAQQARQL